MRRKATMSRIVTGVLLASLVPAVVAAQSAPARKDIPAIAKSANGSIVSIVMSDSNGKPIAQGSGFFVRKDGLVITNYHVIAEGSSAVVKLPDGAFYVVDGVLAFDKARDVAVIKAHGQNFRTLTLICVTLSPRRSAAMTTLESRTSPMRAGLAVHDGC